MSVGPEERLLDALDALAEQVEITPDAYGRAQAEWRRRERRRRILALVLAVLIIAAADAAGLWALNHAKSGSPVVFDGPAPVRLEAPAHRAHPTPGPGARAHRGARPSLAVRRGEAGR